MKADRHSPAELWQRVDRIQVLCFGVAIALLQTLLKLRQEQGGRLRGDHVQ
jgi:hypothetical protein